MDVQTTPRWVAAQQAIGPFRRLRGVDFEEDLEDGEGTFMLVEGKGRRCRARAAVRLTSWARGLKVRSAARGAWHDDEQCPDLRLLSEQGQPTSLRASLVVMSAPQAIRALVGPLHEEQFLVLRLLRYSEPARALVEANPVLGLLAARRVRTAENPVSDWLLMVTRPHRDILSWALGVRPCVAPRWLTRIDTPCDFEPSDLDLLARLLGTEPLARRLRHWPAVDLQLLRRLGERPALLEWRSVHALGAEGRLVELRELLELVCSEEHAGAFEIIDRRFRRSEAATVLREFRRLEGLGAATRRIVLETATRPFVAPVPPGGSVRALTTAWDVIDEGARMSHCIESYLPRIAAGQGFVYHVDGPAPATLYFTLRGGRIVDREFRGFANGEVTVETRQRVREWLARQRNSRPAQDAIRLLS